MDQTRFLLACLAALIAATAVVADEAFVENFDTFEGWIPSAGEAYTGEFKVGSVGGRSVPDPGMYMGEPARKYGISKLLKTPFDPSNGIAFQYEVTLTKGLSCGGAYVKLISESDSFTPEALDGDTGYTIMFGPDKCGGTDKVHLIFRHKSPLTGKIEEKHLKTPPGVPTDNLPHLYTLIVESDNTFQILIDNEVAEEGDLLSNFEPAFTPPKLIPDPEDKKPADWVDLARIPDASAVKPADWDEDAPERIVDLEAEMPDDWLPNEPEYIDDPEAEKPGDWDDEEDGQWEPPKIENPVCEDAPGCGEWKQPMIPNPEYRGKWSPPIVDNPAYKGPWEPRKIDNPEYVEDDAPLQNIGRIAAVALELWSMNEGIFFDNFVLADDGEVTDEYATTVWQPKFNQERSRTLEKGSVDAPELLKQLVNALNDPSLKPLQPYLMPVLDIFLDYPVVLYITLGLAPVLLIALLFCCCCCGGSTAEEPAPPEDAKKTDQEDDAAEAETEGEIMPEPKGEAPTKRRTRRAD